MGKRASVKNSSGFGSPYIDLGWKMDSINLGNGKGFTIDLGLPKMDPCIPTDTQNTEKKNKDNSMLFGLGSFASDISKTVHDTKKDYDSLVSSTKMMKQDLTPGFNRLKGLVVKLWRSLRKGK